MVVKGEYRDVIISNGREIVDTGWRSNNITKDMGSFLAALLKKDFNENVPQRSGIDYIAFGSGSINDEEFKGRVVELIKKDPDLIGLLKINQLTNEWVWAKKIEKSSMKYVDSSGKDSNNPTNSVKVDIVVYEGEPSQETLNFKEFGLFGVDRLDNGKPNPDRIFFINYVSHAGIGKTSSMKLNRTIKLNFHQGDEAHGKVLLVQG